jgi:hypothetical protein
VLGELEQIQDTAELEALTKDIAMLFVRAVEGISDIVAERDDSNNAGDHLPPVLPHELAVPEHADFCSVVRSHRERLLTRWSTSEIDVIGQEHQVLAATYTSETPLRSALDACDEKTTFDSGWMIVKDRFKFLQRFCGGLASVFPGTSQVESDFSIVRGEKDVFRQSLSDLSLEGVLHAKQFDLLGKL